MHVDDVMKEHVLDVEATPSQSKNGVGPAGPPLPDLRRKLPSLLAEIQVLPSDMQVRLRLRRNQEFTCNGIGVGQACAILQRPSHEFTSLRCRFNNR
eukprot:6214604-Pleurochrysis_carterae.AAC.1